MPVKKVVYFCNDPEISEYSYLKPENTTSQKIELKHLSAFNDLCNQDKAQHLSIFDGHGRRVPKKGKKKAYLRATIGKNEKIPAIEVLQTLVKKTEEEGTIVWSSCYAAFLLNDIAKAKKLQKQIAAKKLTVIILGGTSVAFAKSKSEINTLNKLIVASKATKPETVLEKEWAGRYQYFDPKEGVWKTVEAPRCRPKNGKVEWFRKTKVFNRQGWQEESEEDVTEKMYDLSTGYAKFMVTKIKAEEFDKEKAKKYLQVLKPIFDIDNQNKLPKIRGKCLLSFSLLWPEDQYLSLFEATMEVYDVEVLRKSFLECDTSFDLLYYILQHIDKNPGDISKLARILRKTFKSRYGITIMDKMTRKECLRDLVIRDTHIFPKSSINNLFHLGFFEDFNEGDINQIQQYCEITNQDSDSMIAHKNYLKEVVKNIQAKITLEDQKKQDLSIFNGHQEDMSKNSKGETYLSTKFPKNRSIPAVEVLQTLVEKTRRGGTVVWLSSYANYLIEDIGKVEGLQNLIEEKQLTVMMLGGTNQVAANTKSRRNTINKLRSPDRATKPENVVNEEWAGRYVYFDPTTKKWKMIGEVELMVVGNKVGWFRQEWFFNGKDWQKESKEDVTNKMRDLSTGYAEFIIGRIKHEKFSKEKAKKYLQVLKPIFDVDNKNKLPKICGKCLLTYSLLSLKNQYPSLFEATMEVYDVEVLQKSFVEPDTRLSLMYLILAYVDKNPRDLSKLARILRKTFQLQYGITIMDKMTRKTFLYDLVVHNAPRIPESSIDNLFRLGFFEDFNEGDINQIKPWFKITEQDSDIMKAHKTRLKKVLEKVQEKITPQTQKINDNTAPSFLDGMGMVYNFLGGVASSFLSENSTNESTQKKPQKETPKQKSRHSRRSQP